jgi:hypothetical protein
MSEQFQSKPFDATPADLTLPDISLPPPVLPSWLERRFPMHEQITWVRGPRSNPSWERYVTHPVLFVVALALAAVCLGAGWLIGGSWSAMPVLVAVAAGVIVVGSIFVLAIFAGYFTRLVVTNLRVVILQGYEVCRSWKIDDLPRSLIHYRLRPDGERRRAVDLGALQTMLGDSSGQFADSKTIQAFGRHLDQIKARDKGRP